LTTGGSAGAPKTPYNILSIDSASYKGYLSASFISEMESMAYEIADANKDKCPNLKQNSEKRVPMVQIFDLITGSESGALIAGTLVTGDDNGSVRRVKEFFQYAGSYYKESDFPEWIRVFLTLFFLIFTSILIFFHQDKQINEKYSMPTQEQDREDKDKEFSGAYLREKLKEQWT